MGALTVDTGALDAAVVALGRADADVSKELRRADRGLRSLWTRIIATKRKRAPGSISPRQDALVGRGSAGRSLSAYDASGSLSGGMSAANWPFVEFGSRNPDYAGTRLPRFTPGGRIVFPAVKSWAPAATRVYVGVVYDVLRSIPGAEDA